jgi:hypothetical protein
MKTPKPTLKSSLAHKVASAKNDDELYNVKRAAWMDVGHLVVMNNQIKAMGNNEQMILELIGLRLYGKLK